MEAQDAVDAIATAREKRAAEANQAIEAAALQARRTEIKDRATLLETRLSHEFALMGQRMTWLVTSQAFLFTAWVQLVKTDPLGDAATLLLVVLPVIGLGVSLAAAYSINAAMRMVDVLVIDRAAIDGMLGLTAMSPLRRDDWTRVAGHAPTVFLPPLFVAAWLVVLANNLIWDRELETAIVVGFVIVVVRAFLRSWREHGESRILASVKAAWPIQFRAGIDVKAYVAQRGGDLPPSERGAVATVEQFLASAQHTIDHASGHTVASQRGEVELWRTVTDGGEVFEMRAVVVTDDLKAYLKSYERAR